MSEDNPNNTVDVLDTGQDHAPVDISDVEKNVIKARSSDTVGSRNSARRSAPSKEGGSDECDVNEEKKSKGDKMQVRKSVSRKKESRESSKKISLDESPKKDKEKKKHRKASSTSSINVEILDEDGKPVVHLSSAETEDCVTNVDEPAEKHKEKKRRKHVKDKKEKKSTKEGQVTGNDPPVERHDNRKNSRDYSRPSSRSSKATLFKNNEDFNFKYQELRKMLKLKDQEIEGLVNERDTAIAKIHKPTGIRATINKQIRKYHEREEAKKLIPPDPLAILRRIRQRRLVILIFILAFTVALPIIAIQELGTYVQP